MVAPLWFVEAIMFQQNQRIDYTIHHRHWEKKTGSPMPVFTEDALDGYAAKPGSLRQRAFLCNT